LSGGWSQTLFSGAQQQDKGQWAQTEAQEVPAEHEKEQGPVKPALGNPTLAGGLD